MNSPVQPYVLNDIKKFDQFFIGFDNQFNRILKLYGDVSRGNSSYPPYNIKKINENIYLIELAVAGFSESDITIEVHGDVLNITGSGSQQEEQYLFKGIAQRDFKRSFVLNSFVEVEGASLYDGILRIMLKNKVQQTPEPKQIKIG